MSLYDKLKTGIIGGGGLAVGKIFSLKPIDGSGDFAFSRASDGTRRNSSGVIVTDVDNMPRADYKFGRSCPAILSEPLSQNLVVNSEPTTTEGGDSNITYEAFNWVNGFTNCVKYSDNSQTQYRYAGASIANEENTISFFVIMDDLSKPRAGGNTSAFDFYPVIAGQSSSENIKYKECGGNIWRISMNYTPTISSNSNGIVKTTSNSDKGFRVVGWQLEQSSFPTSYMATAGGVTTRQPDYYSQDGDSNNINSPKGTFFIRSASITTDDEERAIYLLGQSGDNQIRIRYYNQGIGVRMIVDGVNVASFSTQQLDQTPFRNIAFNWDETSCSFWVDGEEIGSSVLTGSYPADTLEYVETSYTNEPFNNPFRGWLEELDVYDNNDIDMEDLTDYNTFEEMANNFNYSVQ